MKIKYLLNPQYITDVYKKDDHCHIYTTFDSDDFHEVDESYDTVKTVLDEWWKEHKQ